MSEEQKMRRLWDNAQFVGEIIRAPRRKTTVELVAKDGVKSVNIRNWYQKKGETKWKPDLNGIIIPINQPIKDEKRIITPAADLLDVFIKALEQAGDFEIEGNPVFTPIKPRRSTGGSV